MSPLNRPILVFLASLIIGETASTSTRAVEPSAEYRAVLRRTLELRRERRGIRSAAPVGKIVPYPMPPSLIIRHTREVHGDVESLLRLLRR
jgi:hypothetical protein